MLTDGVIESISSKLTASGLTVMKEYIDDIGSAAANSFPAFIRVERVELCELIQTRNDERRCSAEVTLRIRALGSAAGFFGAQQLSAKTENAIMRIYLSEDMIVKKVVCGGIEKNMSLGRLERIIELTAVTAVGMGGV